MCTPFLAFVSNVYISLQTCHFLSVLEADVHVLRAQARRHRTPSALPLDFDSQRTRCVGGRAITMERIR